MNPVAIMTGAAVGITACLCIVINQGYKMEVAEYKDAVANRNLIVQGSEPTEIIIDGETFLIKEMCINGFQYIMLKNDFGHSVVPSMADSQNALSCKKR